ncbi:hypothetical protein QJS04_geneDACA020720 [Acorus gramineus]|uniref:Uncharacterized protein n=1 Tax=Acorus gramineus TaxID=55184 RepID=A0AAV9BWQ2_ACOGR|nr:hypothetical protein QJS04_geneDACA020720 [Acorus gramineus]
MDRGVAETRTIEGDVMLSMGASGVPSVSGLARAEEKGLHVVEPSSSEWTNEKHSSYLNSIEASFVNQLYRHGGQSRSMIGWLSRTHRSLAPESSQSNSCCRVPSGQFKVLHKGCWKKLNFERDHTSSNQCNENQMLAANPWVQHFISSSGRGARSCNNLETGEFSSQAIPLGDQVHVLENSGLERNLKRPPTCSSNIYRQDSVGSNKGLNVF